MLLEGKRLLRNLRKPSKNPFSFQEGFETLPPFYAHPLCTSSRCGEFRSLWKPREILDRIPWTCPVCPVEIQPAPKYHTKGCSRSSVDSPGARTLVFAAFEPFSSHEFRASIARTPFCAISGDCLGISPICPFPPSRSMNSTYGEQSREGPRQNPDLARKKRKAPRFGSPPPHFWTATIPWNFKCPVCPVEMTRLSRGRSVQSMWNHTRIRSGRPGCPGFAPEPSLRWAKTRVLKMDTLACRNARVLKTLACRNGFWTLFF